jgi:4-amino-4-deoxy-L-arabinose transferase-like glycosyltransferase
VPRRTLLVAILAAAVLPYFVNLGASSIWDANEAFYVETPREMMERGDYLFPTFNYEPRLNKPVLSYWIVAGFYALFGVSPGVQRIPIALGGVALVLVAFLLGRAAWGAPGSAHGPGGGGAPRSPSKGESARAVDAGLVAAAGLAASPRLLVFARRIFIDIYITLFMALALLFFALAERQPGRRRLWLALMYVAVGLGTLTKGPVAIVLPALAFFLYLLVHRELGRIREMMIVPGILILAAIVVPWYAALYQRDGWTYIASFVLGENVARFTDGVGVNAERGPLFYIPVVFSDAFPWSLLLPAAAMMWYADRRRGDASSAQRVRTLLWLWILVIVGFFSLSEAKQDLYIFPIVPAVAALGGVTLVRALGAGSLESRLGAATRWGLIAAGVVLLVLGIGIIFVFRGAAAGEGEGIQLPGALAVGILAFCGGLATMLASASAQTGRALTLAVLTLAAANWAIVVRVLPAFEIYKPVPGLARVLAGRLLPDDTVATYNVAVPSLVYYLRRHIDMAYDPAPIVALIDSGRRAFVILPDRDYDSIRSLARTRTCIVSSHATLDMKLRNVLAHDRLPELLLITNRCE